MILLRRAACAVAALFAMTAVTRGEDNSPDWAPRPVGVESLPNALWITDKVISGASPLGDDGFAALARIGVKTIISVDGAKPDLARAKAHGLRYVHLPHGYDGVPADRAKEIAKAVRDLPGPIYLHCNHGKHRSPAAATVACVSAGMLPAERALIVLRTAHTSPAYRGLYASAERARRLSEQELDAVVSRFPAVVEPPAMIKAMTELEEAVDRLKTVQSAGWRTPDDHPDLDPPHEALLLREHYTELLRTDQTRAKPAGFQELMSAGEEAARRLRAALTGAEADQRQRRADNQLAAVMQNCKDCHVKYRDQPIELGPAERTSRRWPTDQLSAQETGA